VAVHVRRARPGDAAAIGRILADGGAEAESSEAAVRWGSLIGLDDPVVRVADDEAGEVVGFVCAGAPGQVRALHVRPDARERGHGSMLLALALDDLVALGYARVFVLVEPGSGSDEAVLELEVAVPDGDWRTLRTAGYAVLGTFAEPATLVRQEESDAEGLTLVAATGVLEGDSTFAPHGHTVRIHARTL
jgi:N-acetylglutamate synthase-like GNAT family acetyltransferase